MDESGKVFMYNNKQYELIKLIGENEYYSWYSYTHEGGGM